MDKLEQEIKNLITDKKFDEDFAIHLRVRNPNFNELFDKTMDKIEMEQNEELKKFASKVKMRNKDKKINENFDELLKELEKKEVYFFDFNKFSHNNKRQSYPGSSIYEILQWRHTGAFGFNSEKVYIYDEPNLKSEEKDYFELNSLSFSVADESNMRVFAPAKGAENLHIMSNGYDFFWSYRIHALKYELPSIIRSIVEGGGRLEDSDVDGLIISGIKTVTPKKVNLKNELENFYEKRREFRVIKEIKEIKEIK